MTTGLAKEPAAGWGRVECTGRLELKAEAGAWLQGNASELT